jgi:hypothetical protein
MKKTTFIFMIVSGLFVFNITQASAGCNIVWTGDLSGSVPTEETSITVPAAKEAHRAIFGTDSNNFNNNCWQSSYIVYMGHGGYIRNVCMSGDYTEEYFDSLTLDSYLTRQGTWSVNCDSTLIELAIFRTFSQNHKIILSWSTVSEIDTAGFNLYRTESEDGKYIKINDALIPAQGSSTQGASYEFIDTDVKNRKTYYYKLEDRDLNGTSTIHGPVSAMPRWILGIFGIFKK